MSEGGIAIPEMKQVEATADLVFRVADAVCAGVVIDRPVQLGPQLTAKVPHFGGMLLKMREDWPTPDPVQAAKIEFVEALATFQRAVYTLGPKVQAAMKAAADLALLEKFSGVDVEMPPEPPSEDRPPQE